MEKQETIYYILFYTHTRRHRSLGVQRRSRAPAQRSTFCSLESCPCFRGDQMGATATAGGTARERETARLRVNYRTLNINYCITGYHLEGWAHARGTRNVLQLFALHESI
jgi:hypothetical protein